jgi:hypothetical protein
MVNGKTGEVEINTRKASDNRHPPLITSFILPATHDAWPEGTILLAGTNAGEALADTVGDGQDIIGVLESAVEENEANGNVLIHGSCPAETLKWFDSGAETDANADQITALRVVGIYV